MTGYYHQDGATLNFGFTVTSSAIIVVPEGTKNFTINNYKYKLTYLGDNKYKIEFVRPDQTPDNSIEIHHDYLGQNANDSAISQIRVESYS